MRTVSNQLKLFSLFVDGEGYAGKADAELPDLEFNTEDYDTGVGIVKQLMSLNALECTLTMQGLEPGPARLLDTSTHAAPRIVLRGSVEEHDRTVAVKVTMEGPLTKVGGVSTERGSEKLEQEYLMNPRVYRYEYAGEVIHDIDIDNAVVTIAGDDKMAAHRANAGV